MITLFFATDIHGSEICWKKFINAGKFYSADMIILGGDLTGKAIVPMIDQGKNAFRVTFQQQEALLHGDDEVEEMEKRIQNRGYYPYRASPEEIASLNAAPEQVDVLFKSLVLQRAERWLAYADEKLAGNAIPCYVTLGNDDLFELDDLVCVSRSVQLVEGQVIELGEGHEMVSSGWSNLTPWRTYREENDEQLKRRYMPMLERLKNPENSVFNLHIPPYGSMLDDAPELTKDLAPTHAGQALTPVGSHAVREIIENYHPLLGLFGHIHEGRGAVHIQRTLCINPGSMYEQGRLQGALVKLERDQVKNYVLTNG